MEKLCGDFALLNIWYSIKHHNDFQLPIWLEHISSKSTFLKRIPQNWSKKYHSVFLKHNYLKDTLEVILDKVSGQSDTGQRYTAL